MFENFVPPFFVFMPAIQPDLVDCILITWPPVYSSLHYFLFLSASTLRIQDLHFFEVNQATRAWLEIGSKSVI